MISILISAVLEGFAVVVSPCVLSILPLIFSSSVHGSKVKLIGVLTGLFGSFIIFSLVLGQIIRSLGFSDNLVRLIAAGLIVFSCLFMFSSRLSDFLGRFLQPLASAGQKMNLFVAEKLRVASFLGGLMMGVCLGLIWTPCVGPIFGAALTQAVSQISFLDNILVMISFALGVSAPIVAIVFGGRYLVNQIRFFQQNAVILRRGLAMVILVSVVCANFSLLSKAFSNWNDFSSYHGTIESANVVRVGCSIEI